MDTVSVIISIMTRKQLIAYNFKRLRNGLDLTQAELAEKVGVSTGYVGKVEAGKADSFGTQAEEKWSRFFGVPLYELLLPPEVINAFGLLREILKYDPKIIPQIYKLLPILGESNEERSEAPPLPTNNEGVA